MNKLEILPAGVLAVRPGHGANCSSVGSVVDVLFATSVLSSSLLVAVAALVERAPEEPERSDQGPAAGTPPQGSGEETRAREE